MVTVMKMYTIWPILEYMTKSVANSAKKKLITVNNIAIKKFINGPATETIASQVPLDLLLVKLLGFISTGLPQPIWANINSINPKGSKCFIGSKVSLPWFLGVVSPNLSAAKACANSWQVIAITTAGSVSKIEINSPRCHINKWI